MRQLYKKPFSKMELLMKKNTGFWFHQFTFAYIKIPQQNSPFSGTPFSAQTGEQKIAHTPVLP